MVTVIPEPITTVHPPRRYRYSTEWEQLIYRAPQWFSESAMRAFGSRILWGTLRPMAGDNFTFITSEDYRGVRKYTVREWYPNGVMTLGEFWAHDTRSAALGAQAKYHKEEEDYVKSFDNE